MKTKAKKSNRPATLQECIDAAEPITRFQDAYQKWLTVDYKDILAWNIAILKALKTATNGNDAVKLSFLLARLNRKPSYVSFLKHNSLNRVAMPLLYGMRPSAFRALAAVYDDECQQSRERLPQAHECSVQLAIDKAVCKHTGYPYDICAEARRMLSYEPMVTGHRYQSNPEPTNPQLFDDTRATRGDGEEKDFAFANIPQHEITVRKHLLDSAERFDMQSELAPCGVRWRGKPAVNLTAEEIAHILDTAKNFKFSEDKK